MSFAANVPADWWRTFFTEDYCFLYRHEFAPRRTAAEVRMVTALLRLAPGARLLDLCCGHARHLHLLREAGFRAVGVDRSPEQLHVAQSRQETFGLPLPVARGEARQLPFKTAFDAVISINGSFAYFDDEGNRRHLGEAARVLKPGGRYLLDQQNPARLLRELPPRRESVDRGTGARILEEFEIDRAASRLYGRKRIRLHGEDREYMFALRLYPPDEMTGLLAEVGLRVNATAGDYDLSAFSAASDRMILVARKEAP